MKTETIEVNIDFLKGYIKNNLLIGTDDIDFVFRYPTTTRVQLLFTINGLIIFRTEKTYESTEVTFVQDNNMKIIKAGLYNELIAQIITSGAYWEFKKTKDEITNLSKNTHTTNKPVKATYLNTEQQPDENKIKNLEERIKRLEKDVYQSHL